VRAVHAHALASLNDKVVFKFYNMQLLQACMPFKLIATPQHRSQSEAVSYHRLSQLYIAVEMLLRVCNNALNNFVRTTLLLQHTD
jgi:hypothetical protein